MTKKIFALVMVISVLSAFVAGCKGGDETKTDAPATTTGTADKTATTTGDAAK